MAAPAWQHAWLQLRSEGSSSHFLVGVFNHRSKCCQCLLRLTMVAQWAWCHNFLELGTMRLRSMARQIDPCFQSFVALQLALQLLE